MNNSLQARRVTAQAPGKVILFGEHAINRGQSALSAAVGLYAHCSVSVSDSFTFRAPNFFQKTPFAEILKLGQEIDTYLEKKQYEEIRKVAKSDFFAPQKYILSKIFPENPGTGFGFEWQSEVPPSSGLGSGGSAFTAMVAGLTPFLESPPPLELRAQWAQLGDIVAHGGVASGLDTQTSLLGGVIRYSGKGLAENIPVAPSLPLLIVHTGISAPTSEVNSKVRLWVENKPQRRPAYFESLAPVIHQATEVLKEGDWARLGQLFTLNHFLLEKIGVSTPRTEELIDVAIETGAYGAKISGSGGGGIFIAVCPPDRLKKIAEDVSLAGGKCYLPSIGVAGAQFKTDSNS